MFSLNRIDIIGYQTQPVTVRKTPGGLSVTDLNLVVPFSLRSEKGDLLSLKSFHTVTMWGSMADIAGQFVRQGSQIFVSGRLQTDSWEDTETKEKKSKTKIVALDMIMLDPKSGQMDAPASARNLTSNLNRAMIIGNTTREPEMRMTSGGQSVASFGIATNERWKDKATGELKERSEFHNVVLWGDLAKEAQLGIKKGQRVFVSGRVQTRSWETKEGAKRYTTEIVADQVTLLGLKNPEAAASMSEARSSEQPEPVGVASTQIPEIKYESEIKASDLPF